MPIVFHILFLEPSSVDIFYSLQIVLANGHMIHPSSRYTHIIIVLLAALKIIASPAQWGYQLFSYDDFENLPLKFKTYVRMCIALHLTN